MRIHGESGATYIFSAKEHTFPMLAAVGRAKDTAFLLRSRGASEGAGKYDVRIRWVHDDAADAAGFWKTHVAPCFPRIRRLIDSVAHHVAITDYPGFTGSRPNDAGVGRRDGQGADGGCGLLVKDRRPSIASVRGLPNAAGSRSRVVSARISRHAGNRRNAISDFRADKAEPHLVLVLRVRLLCVR